MEPNSCTPTQEADGGCRGRVIHCWLPIEDNQHDYDQEAKRNCLVKFDNGETRRHFQEWPIAEVTHFLPVKSESM